MRSRLSLLTLALYLLFTVVACTSKAPSDDASNSATSDSNAPGAKDTGSAEHKEHKEAKRALVVPAGTEVTISLGSSIGSKLSKPGQSFSGSVAKDVVVGSAVAIPAGTNVTGTVTDAKPLGKFAGGAALQVRLDSINLEGKDVPVQAAARSFSEKGKGKRTAVITGGGAALGAIIGGLAGGGKGAAIGAGAGGAAGAGGSAFTGNKEIVLPAESALSFELTKALEVRR